MPCLRPLAGCPPRHAPPDRDEADGSKTERMIAQSAKIEAGHVLLPVEAPWRNEFLADAHTSSGCFVRITRAVCLASG